MRGTYSGPVVVAAVLSAGLVAPAQAEKIAPQTDAELIASAMAAAPKQVAEGATIVVMDEKGGMQVLRQGTNGFTCMPDNPTTPVRTRCAWTRTRWNGRMRG